MNSSQQRRTAILQLLQTHSSPLSASHLAKELGVSRQIIVGDVALLRAGGAHIVATPRGYVMEGAADHTCYTIPCCHTPQEMEEELNLIVDHGCTVETVVVEHPVYGQLVGQLNLSSRFEVAQFVDNMHTHHMSPLSNLTHGIHLHQIRCPDPDAVHTLMDKLRQRGFLVE